MIVTEQSHVFKTLAGVVFRFQRSFLGSALCLLDLLLFLFSDYRCRSYALCAIWFMFGMAHFSTFDDSCSRVVQKRLPLSFASYEHSLHSIM